MAFGRPSFLCFLKGKEESNILKYRKIRCMFYVLFSLKSRLQYITSFYLYEIPSLLI